MAPSIIGEDLTVTGNIISKGEIQVDGEVQGDVYCSRLVVGDRGRVNGGIVAEDATIHGRVTGSIHALEVSLEANAHVEGDICHQALKLDHGSSFEGQSRRSDDPLSQAGDKAESFLTATAGPGSARLRARLDRAA